MLVGVVSVLLTTSGAFAATIVGTAGADVLRGHVGRRSSLREAGQRRPLRAAGRRRADGRRGKGPILLRGGPRRRERRARRACRRRLRGRAARAEQLSGVAVAATAVSATATAVSATACGGRPAGRLLRLHRSGPRDLHHGVGRRARHLRVLDERARRLLGREPVDVRASVQWAERPAGAGPDASRSTTRGRSTRAHRD